ncbi:MULTISPECIES: hypothetical protein [Xanthomonas]|uniref:Uncharacterized protein n=3 Tax=Xanthomonas TaxID=338 RepID=A0A0U5F962_XANCI|nr:MULTISPECIES: hypothetical protein [Xanthomonas]MBV6747198.1 hypothetical protein [Xanthomonas vasicola pv. vasculorum NCPPB 890]MBV6892731.1 hypothetical protein [Xanthomonas vasicola pv. vasculorum]MDO6948481.1 hypothetical protein [Xanthomonas vasicola]MDO6960481.1 hypothetical protein [Xanthomonas vasicola]QRD58335.1 hypothetical protein H8Z75_23340 [Xanthomonas citri pv. citri]
MKAKRNILFLDSRFPVEREVCSILEAAPKGERAALLRAMILIGHSELKEHSPKPNGTGEGVQNADQAP